MSFLKTILQFCVLAVAVVFLSGCSSSATKLQQVALATGKPGSDKSLVVLRVSSQKCPFGGSVIARKTPKGYKAVTHVDNTMRYFRGRKAAWTKIDPGIYHIVNFGCQLSDRNVSLSIGQSRSEGSLFNKTYYYDKSFASFTVKPGEVVNVGHLQFIPMPGMPNRYGYIVRGLSEGAKTEMQHRSPEIFKRMKTRMMVKG